MQKYFIDNKFIFIKFDLIISPKKLNKFSSIIIQINKKLFKEIPTSTVNKFKNKYNILENQDIIYSKA